MTPVPIADLELDLEVFSGPFDLLLTLVLREEVDLLEVELADVVLSYLDFLESRGELDLEAATEFLVLIAALLELKSRLMLPREEDELLDLEPGEAADELLARMLEARRYRRAAEHLARRLADEDGHRFRAAPLPPALRRVTYDDAGAVYEPAQLGAAIGGLLRVPPPLRLDHLTVPRVTVAERLSHLRSLLRRGACSFDEAVRGADRVTVAVTLFALLELYKQGEATWRQDEPFGDIAITAMAHVPESRGGGVVSALARTLEALLFLSSEPVSAADLAAAAECDADELAEALDELRAAYAPGERGLVLRELAGGFTLATAPETEPAARRLLAKPRTPPLTPAQAETLAIVAYLQPVSRPEITRIRGVSADSASGTLLERGPRRGGRALAVRRGPLPHDAALPQALRARVARRPARPERVGPDARRGGRPARAPAQGRRGAGRRRPRGGRRGLSPMMRTLSEDLAERMREGGDGRSDIWRAFADRELFARVVAALAVPYRGERYTKVAGLEARGFVLGGAMAAHTGAGFVAVRKADGWLPGDLAETVTEPDWQGHTHALRLQRDALDPDDRVVLVDDWFETGAQALAARQLIESTGATLVGMSIVVDDLSDEARDGPRAPARAATR